MAPSTIDGSVSRRIGLACPQCGFRHETEFWETVDVGARPDLAASLRAGRHFLAECPNGHTYEMNEPALLYLTTPRLSLFFVSPEGVNEQESKDALMRLVHTLDQSILDTVYDVEKKAELQTVHRMFVSASFADSSESQQLASPLSRLMSVWKLEAVATILKHYPELLTSAAREFLRQAEETQSDTDEGRQRAKLIKARRDFLGGFATWFQDYDRNPSGSDGTLDPLGKAVLAWMCFKAIPSFDDLKQAIELTVHALQFLDHDMEMRAALMAMLGNQLRHRFGITRSSSDLDDAIAAVRQAVEAAPSGHKKKASYLSELSLLLYYRFWLINGSLEDISAAVAAATEAVALSPQGRERTGYLHELSNWLSSRYELTSNPADLDAAIAAGDEALACAPPDNPDRMFLLNAPGRLYYKRFLSTGARNDLNTAIAAAEEALTLATADQPARSLHLTNLANALSERSRLTGALEDVNTAVDAARESLALMPEASADRPMLFNNLSNRLSERFGQTGAIEDLDAAITAAEQATALAEEGQSDEAMFFDNLGNRLATRYRLTKLSQDLDAAIAAAERAISLTPAGHILLPINLGNLSIHLSQRSERTQSKGDLDAAIATAKAAVSLMSESNPRKPQDLFNIGEWLSTRFRLNGSRADISAAIAAFREAVSILQGRTLESEDASAISARAALATRQLIKALRAADDDVGLIGALEMGKAVRLRADLARSQRYPSHLNAVERQRYDTIARRIKEIDGELRSLDRLAVMHRPETFARDVTVLSKERARLVDERRQLEAGDPAFSDAPLDYAKVSELTRRTLDCLVYLQPQEDMSDGLLAVIVHAGSPKDRPAPGDVMQINGWHRDAVTRLLFEQYSEVYHTLTEDSSVPVKIQGSVGWLAAYLLSKLSEPDGETLWASTIASVLGVLGLEVMVPVAKRLREIGANRVVLIPGDRLGILPLHAAPIDDQATPFGEVFETRYAPSATVLSHCVGRCLPASGALRLIGIANPDHSLPFSDIEMRAVASVFGDLADVKHGPEARRQWLLDHAGASDIVSLSTHAIFAMGRPELSYFMLAHPGPNNVCPTSDGDGQPSTHADFERLALDDILRGELSLKPGAIVVADACETGQTAPTENAEEYLGFPSAFLASGAGTVIASFWSVNDFSTALLMENFYDRVRVGDVPARALRQASAWLRRLSQEEVIRRLESEVSRLAQEICTKEQTSAPAGTPQQGGGAPPLALLELTEILQGTIARIQRGPQFPFKHPYHWAAFATYGV